MAKARADRIVEAIKANRFVLIVVIVILLMLAYLIIRIFGIVLTTVATAFFIGMYKAKDKTYYITLLKTVGVIALLGGVLLIIIFSNHEWPIH